MICLYLMQHGLANSSHTDLEEGLSLVGERQIYDSAFTLRAMNLCFDLILMSPKKRSKQTAEIIAQETKSTCDFLQTEALKPLASAQEAMVFLSRYEAKKHIFIAGHLPSLQNLSSYLLGQQGLVNLAITNGGCMCIELTHFAQSQGSLKWMLSADLLQEFAKIR